MPLKSKAQRRFLHATNPALAAKFERETPKGARLPERKRKRKPPWRGSEVYRHSRAAQDRTEEERNFSHVFHQSGRHDQSTHAGGGGGGGKGAALDAAVKGNDAAKFTSTLKSEAPGNYDVDLSTNRAHRSGRMMVASVGPAALKPGSNDWRAELEINTTGRREATVEHYTSSGRAAATSFLGKFGVNNIAYDDYGED